jgi:hypothetical protein
MKTSVKLLSLAFVGGSLLAAIPADAATYFRDNDRVILRTYSSSSTTTTDSMGNTTTTTYYTPGMVIPDTVTFTPLPPTITTKLAPAPDNAEYVIINGNAYLVDREKRIVIDATRLND